MLRVRDLDAPIASYRKIFDMEPRRESFAALKAASELAGRDVR